MRVTSNGRVRRSAAEWNEILRKFKASGLSSSVFCRREDLVPSSFNRWQKRLSSKASTPFVELVAPGSSPESPWTLEVSLPNGVRLEFRG